MNTSECTKNIYIKVFHTNGDSRLHYEEFIVFGTMKAVGVGFMFLVANLKKNFDINLVINLVCEFLDKFSKYDKDTNNVISPCGLNIIKADFSNCFFWEDVGGISLCLNMKRPSVERFVVNIENYKKDTIVVNNAYSLKYNYFIDDIYDVRNSIDIKVGSFCRSCGEYNNYAEVDKVIEDGKHTCWNCANSDIRIYRGLNCDNLNKAVMMIRKNNNIREEYGMG
jgi:hypothetical protein